MELIGTDMGFIGTDDGQRSCRGLVEAVCGLMGANEG